MIEETIEIKNHAYNPPSLGAKIGDKLTWTNYDEDEHSVTFENDEYPEGELHKGESYSLVFDREGTFAYYCRYHPEMKAKIVVG